MSDRTTYADTLNAISSRALEDGRSQLDWLDGLTIDRSGQDHAPASRSALPASRPARKTNATSGPNSSASSVPEGPMSGWENRLRQRLESIGSTECVLTWEASATPAGHPLFRLVPSMRPIGEIACGLWPTPTSLAPARNGNNEAGNSAGLVAIRKIALSMWATPTSRDGKNFGTEAWAADRADKSRRGLPLPEQVADHIGPAAIRREEGALNPQFVCWLMGFPPAWESCAPTAMPSSRKSRRK